MTKSAAFTPPFPNIYTSSIPKRYEKTPMRSSYQFIFKNSMTSRPYTNQCHELATPSFEDQLGLNSRKGQTAQNVSKIPFSKNNYYISSGHLKVHVTKLRTLRNTFCRIGILSQYFLRRYTILKQQQKPIEIILLLSSQIQEFGHWPVPASMNSTFCVVYQDLFFLWACTKKPASAEK
jgi:hypothetical protein